MMTEVYETPDGFVISDPVEAAELWAAYARKLEVELRREQREAAAELRRSVETMQRDHLAMEAARAHRRLAPGSSRIRIERMGLDDTAIGREMDGFAEIFLAALNAGGGGR